MSDALQYRPIADWEKRLHEATVPLPGAEPYINRRALSVRGQYDGYALLAFLCARHHHLSEDFWRAAIVEDVCLSMANLS
ncbi:MAG: hypothetical protein R3C68_05490 [Myxococcota bacterium]